MAFFAQTQDAVKLFKVRLSGLQPIVSHVNSDIRNFLFRDVQINRVGVSVMHVKLFRGNVLCSQNGQRGISHVTVLNNRGHVIGKVHGHFQKRTLPTSTEYVTFGEIYNEIPWSIDRMKLRESLLSKYRYTAISYCTVVVSFSNYLAFNDNGYFS